MPGASLSILETTPIFDTTKAPVQTEATVLRALHCYVRSCVDPVLKGIDSRDQEEDIQDSLQMLLARALEIFSLRIEHRKVFASPSSILIDATSQNSIGA
jgi:hypothetical protein